MFSTTKCKSKEYIVASIHREENLDIKKITLIQSLNQ